MIKYAGTLFLCLVVQIFFSQNYTTRLFSSADGLPDNYVYALVQDDKGYLWVASGKGLARFDGQVFLSFPLEKAEENTLVYTGLLDKNKDLWFGTFDGKLYKLDPKKQTLQLYPKQVPGSITRILASSIPSRLYILCKGQGIFLLENNRLEKIQGTDNYVIKDLIEQNANTLLFVSSEGLHQISLQNATIKNLSAITGNATHLLPSQLAATYFVATTDQGFYHLQLKDSSLDILQHISPKELPAYTALTVDETRHELYLSGQDEKLYAYNLHNHHLKTLDAGLYQASGGTLLLDRENTLWVGTIGKGLYAFYRSNFEVLPAEQQAVYCMAQDSAKTNYLGTAQGLLVMDAAGNLLRKLHTLGAKALGKVNAIHLDAQNRLWIGTDEQGLFVCDKTTFAPIPVEFTNIRPMGINAIRASKNDGEIQVCTKLAGVFSYLNGKRIRQLSVENGLLHNNVYDAIKNKKGIIYYAMHNTGFNMWQEDKVFEIEIKDRQLSTDFNCFAEDPQGNIYIGSNGGGISILSGNLVKAFERNHEFESRYCKALLFDQDHHLWAILGTDLYKYYPEQQVLKRMVLTAGQAEAPVPHNLYTNREGAVYVCTDQQVILVHNGQGAKNTTAPAHSYLLSLRINDSLVDLRDSLQLSNGKYHLKFEYSALALKNSAQVLFRYLLEGRDAGWSELTRNRVVEFANLSEGDYTLKIKAINSEGFEEPHITEFHFTIQPPFWKSHWFWIALSLLLLLIFILVIRIRTASLIKAKYKLEQLVQEKTRELREEKRLVEESKRVIEDQNHEIKDSILYAKRIQDAILPDKKIITDRADRIFVCYQPRDIVSGDFYWLGEVNGIKIVVAADCTGHGVPGAFMSMIGNTLLNKIVIERKISKASEILKELDKEVRRALKQYSQESTKDGMDVALVCVDDARQELTYCGALRPLLHIRNKQLTVYAPNKHSIGGFNYGKTREFEETLIPMQKNDMLYLFSDGYADQFGGAQGKKFMLKNFKELLLQIADKDLHEQETIINTTYNTWKGTQEQVDDVLVIGLRM